MSRPTFIRFVLLLFVTLGVSILFLSARLKTQRQPNTRQQEEVTKPAMYGEYIIWESLGNTILR
ncbi:MAG TPA: hypothetical protein VM012_11595 [Flavitalea sp.]|nr:hypothetical protein [Flavitalea sp.]